MKSRKDMLALLKAEPTGWDLIVVGGGITGAGVALEAARQGQRVLLLEQRDFAWGTSSRSSKMVHGGLRYLAQGDVSLTRHSVQERQYLMGALPGLVRPMEYHYVLGAKSPSRIAVKLLLWIYDRLAGITHHRYLNRKAFSLANPGFDVRRATGAYAYSDAATDDSRLVLRILAEACAAGARCLNYCQVLDLELAEGRVAKLQLEDVLSGDRFKVSAPVIVNATGAWADRLRNRLNPEKRIRPQRGSHIVLSRKRLPVEHALTLRHPEDGRYHFIYPWAERTIVGTTDLDHGGDLDVEASITPAEVEYLLASANYFFPHAEVERKHILSTWAGVRPIISSEKSRDPSRERRDHAVWTDANLVTVSGGKLTTFRLIARDVMDRVNELQARPQATLQPNWVAPVQITPDELYSRGAELAPYYIARYGQDADELVASALAAGRSEELLPIHDSHYSLADLRWALQREQAVHLDDLLLRHTPLGLVLHDGGAQLMEPLAQIFLEERGLSADAFRQEQVRYEAIFKAHYSVS